MKYLGDYKEDATLTFLWSTNDKNGGEATRTTDGTVHVYKDDDLTQSVAGVTDTKNFDGITGIHCCEIDLSADAFYVTGSDYNVILNGAVIDDETVNAVLATFSIQNRFAGSDLFTKAAKVLTNKAVQNKSTGEIEYFDDDGQTVILTQTPNESRTELTREPS